MAESTRRHFLFLVASAAPGVWLAGSGLLQLAHRFVLALGGSCSFCGKAAHEVERLAGVVTRPTRICDECLGLCLDILEEESIKASAATQQVTAEELVRDRDDELRRILGDLGGMSEGKIEAVLADVRRRLDGERKRPLADFQCSFCDKHRRDVAKLISGPRVFICDGCVGDATAIVSKVLGA